MMTKNLIPLVVAVIGVLSRPVAADTLSHDYLEAALALQQVETGTDDIEGSGFQIDFSKMVFGNFYVTGNFNQYQFDDVENFDIKQYAYSVGAGYHYPISWRLDFYGQLAYAGIESEISSGIEKDYGLEARFGLRAVPFETIEELELEAFIDYVDYPNPIASTLSATSGSLQARWYFNKTISLGGGVNVGEYTTAAFLSFRVDFNNIRF